MSVTSGVVSRIEVTPYAHGGAELLGVQVRGGWWWVGGVGVEWAYSFIIYLTFYLTLY